MKRWVSWSWQIVGKTHQSPTWLYSRVCSYLVGKVNVHLSLFVCKERCYSLTAISPALLQLRWDSKPKELQREISIVKISPRRQFSFLSLSLTFQFLHYSNHKFLLPSSTLFCQLKSIYFSNLLMMINCHPLYTHKC